MEEQINALKKEIANLLFRKDETERQLNIINQELQNKKNELFDLRLQQEYENMERRKNK